MIEYQVAGCLVEAADQLGYTLEPDTGQWPHTCGHHPDLLLPAVDAGTAHAAATFTHGLLASTLGLLREQTTGGDPEQAATHARLLAAAYLRHDQTAQRLCYEADRYRAALQRLVRTGADLVRHNRPAGPAGCGRR